MNNKIETPFSRHPVEKCFHKKFEKKEYSMKTKSKLQIADFSRILQQKFDCDKIKMLTQNIYLRENFSSSQR